MNKFWYKIENDKKLTFWAKEFGSMAITEIEQSDSYQARSKHFEKIQNDALQFYFKKKLTF